MPVIWKAEYESGEKHVDQQHQHLFEYVNTLEALIERVKAGEPLDTKAVEDLVVFVDTYVNIHFAYEEMCFLIRKCPFAQKNRDAHNGLLKFWGEFTETAKTGVDLEMLEHLHRTMQMWLTNHICSVDIQLKYAAH